MTYLKLLVESWGVISKTGHINEFLVPIDQTKVKVGLLLLIECR
jgi:hypothetical protein